ncbi:MAG: hypothetical protein J6S48_05940 [Bacteroidales bacterium]|nr:hypothetical protein [Bacteroidales bacterium]
MKKIIFLLSLLALVILFASCNIDEKKARKVGYDYAFAMANYQVDEAAKYATEETRQTTLVLAKNYTAAVGEEYVKSDTPAKLETVDFTRIDDTTAIMNFHKTTPIKDTRFSLLLRKRNGQWMAHDTIPTMTKTPEAEENAAPEDTAQ